MGTLLTGLTLKISEPKKKRASKEYTRESNKIVYGTVIKDNDTYKVQIKQDKNGEKNPVILDFTPESFSLEGRRRVFRRELDNGRAACVIRDKCKAKFFPGLEEQYIPFWQDWTVKGYIVKQGLVKLFSFKDLVGVGTYIVPKEEYSI